MNAPEIQYQFRRWSLIGGLALGLLIGTLPAVALADGSADTPDAVTTALVGSANGLAIPPADPVLAFVAPSPDQPNYAARLDAFLQATVAETWNGQPVGFLSALGDAGGVDVLGLPTSAPRADPNNPGFVYQRFGNGVLFYNAAEGSTQALGF